MSNKELAKKTAACAAINFIKNHRVIGVGTGSTVKYFIEALADHKHRLDGAIASSHQTQEQLKAHHIPILELNAVAQLPIYIDGADSFNNLKQLIKGGGGALTREKILANASCEFICIVDSSKQATVLGDFPVPIEVIPMARSYVAREITKLGGQPVYRNGFTTDNGNIILDVHQWEINHPIDLENKLNQIAGIVCNGLFAKRGADKIIISQGKDLKIIN